MASRRKLAVSSGHYKTKARTYSGGSSDGSVSKAKQQLSKNEETGFEKKMQIRSEAKAILGRIDKLTSEFGMADNKDDAKAFGSYSSPSERASGKRNSLGSNSKTAGRGELLQGSIKQHDISSEMEFKLFQQNKGRMTMLMVDHEKVSSKECLPG